MHKGRPPPVPGIQRSPVAAVAAAGKGREQFLEGHPAEHLGI